MSTEESVLKKIASNLMSRVLIKAQASMMLDDVTHLFSVHRCTMVPVLNDDDGRILGCLTEVGLLKILLLRQLGRSTGTSLKECQNFLEPISTVDTDASFTDVVKEIVQSKSNRLLVTDRTQKIIGIISPKDIIAALDAEYVKFKQAMDPLKKAGVEAVAKAGPEANISLDMYKTLFDRSPYMTHSLNSKGVIILANAALHEILGYSPGELIGKSYRDLYNEKYWQAAEGGLREIINNGSLDSTISSMRCKNGKYLPVEIRSTSLEDKEGSFLGTISVVRRIDTDAAIRSVVELMDAFGQG